MLGGRESLVSMLGPLEALEEVEMEYKSTHSHWREHCREYEWSIHEVEEHCRHRRNEDAHGCHPKNPRRQHQRHRHGTPQGEDDATRWLLLAINSLQKSQE